MFPPSPSRAALDCPELYDYRRWLGCPETRQQSICQELAEVLGTDFQVEKALERVRSSVSSLVDWPPEPGSSVLTLPSSAAWSFRHLPSGLVFKLVPGGQFQMGFSQEEEAYLDSDEFKRSPSYPTIRDCDELTLLFQAIESMRPAHLVSLSPFLMTQTPLTGEALEQWGIWLDNEEVYRVFCGDNEITYITPEELRILLRQTPFRLATEAQWEHACRAGTQSLFFWGNRPPTEPHRLPNSFGLLELGNHPEVCQDLWHPNYEGAPCDGSAWTQAPALPHPVIRGGASMIFPWQDCGEWQLMLSALRRPLNLEAPHSADKQVAVRLVHPL